ncbi:MAG: phenylalanine--tRNA ligase subunit alpha [Candidatus Nanoarchaeia archaeon]|nr:phenylalanine--tRNA ligase subunit alpha [Candidatus Nanoarchaeia archaeon]
MAEINEIDRIVESLSPNEIKILPFLKEHNLIKITEKSGLDNTSTLRALEFLSNKKIVELKTKQEKMIELGINGILYTKHNLPERRLANLVCEKNSISLKEAQRQSGLNENEFKAAIGVLKKKALINVLNENLVIAGSKEEITSKTLEERFLETLPKKLEDLKPEERYAFNNLKSRKEIIELNDKKTIEIGLTKLGERLISHDFSSLKGMIEPVTPSIIQSGSWKGKKFRRYDLKSQVPRIFGGKRHFVNQATDYAKKIWLEMGFKEMTGNLTVSGFWNFDTLFSPQDHPSREMQDTFFIKNKTAKLPDKTLVEEVKKAHEGKIKGSKGWQYEWKEDDAKKVLLRTHTTCLSAQTLKKIADNKEFPAKYFALGKVFRNETVDWSHAFDFNMTEGIVIDENANFRQLLGYLTEFFKKMGYEKIRIKPTYYPFTEPSLEIDIYHPVHKKWLELGGAGMFRPEVTIPFFGKHIPVLAWGPGFDRIIMEFYEIKDLREMYANDLNKSREMRIWNR